MTTRSVVSCVSVDPSASEALICACSSGSCSIVALISPDGGTTIATVGAMPSAVEIAIVGRMTMRVNGFNAAPDTFATLAAITARCVEIDAAALDVAIGISTRAIVLDVGAAADASASGALTIVVVGSGIVGASPTPEIVAVGALIVTRVVG